MKSNLNHEDTRPPHQQLFPTHLIEAAHKAYDESYRMHLQGLRWSAVASLELVALGQLHHDIARDTIFAAIKATSEAAALHSLSATLLTFNAAPTVEEFLMELSGTMLGMANNDAAERKMKLLLGSLHSEWVKLHPEANGTEQHD